MYTDSPWPLDVPFGSVISKGQRSRSLGVKKVKLLRQPYLKLYRAPVVETLCTDSPWPLNVTFGSVITKGQRSRSLWAKKGQITNNVKWQI